MRPITEVERWDLENQQRRYGVEVSVGQARCREGSGKRLDVPMIFKAPWATAPAGRLASFCCPVQGSVPEPITSYCECHVVRFNAATRVSGSGKAAAAAASAGVEVTKGRAEIPLLTAEPFVNQLWLTGARPCTQRCGFDRAANKRVTSLMQLLPLVETTARYFYTTPRWQRAGWDAEIIEEGQTMLMQDAAGRQLAAAAGSLQIQVRQMRVLPTAGCASNRTPVSPRSFRSPCDIFSPFPHANTAFTCGVNRCYQRRAECIRTKCLFTSCRSEIQLRFTASLPTAASINATHTSWHATSPAKVTAAPLFPRSQRAALCTPAALHSHRLWRRHAPRASMRRCCARLLHGRVHAARHYACDRKHSLPSMLCYAVASFQCCVFHDQAPIWTAMLGRTKRLETTRFLWYVSPQLTLEGWTPQTPGPQHA